MHAKKSKQKNLIIFFLFAAITILSACAPAAEEPAAPVEEPVEPAEEPAEEPAAPEEPFAPEEPEEPIDPSPAEPVQYGQDSRTELVQHTDPKLQEMGASVAIFVHSNQVKISGNTVTLDGYTLNEMSESGQLVKDTIAPLCTGELFASQIAPGFCTGFLVKEDILVTAGHCLNKVPCSDTSIVFGYYMEPDNSLTKLTMDNVFKCVEIIAQVSPNQDNQFLDYAIIKLDRPTSRDGLDYSIIDDIGAQDNVAVIGHPSGIPLKIASNAVVLINETEEPFFVTNLDTFGSNSGSPVINTDTYQVDGILVRGVADYVLSDDGSCVQVNRCPESGDTNCSGENATKMAMLAEQISESTATSSGGLNCYPNLLLILGFVTLARKKTI